MVAVYPFMKRVTYWPQIVLGLAFSWGALMGWPATFGRLDWPALVLYAGSIAWVIGYDTIYAHQDREDDALIGIKSTALLFGENTRPMLAVFYTLAVALMAFAGWGAGAGIVFSIGLACVRRAALLADQPLPDRRSGPVPAAVQVEPRRRIDFVCGDGARRAGAADGWAEAGASIPRDDLALAMHGGIRDRAARPCAAAEWTAAAS